MKFRSERVSGLIQQELTKLIAKTLEFQNAIVTVTGVAVDNKLGRAVVSVGIIPGKNVTEILKQLNDARGDLQFRLARTLNIKPMPHIVFVFDGGAQNAAAVEKILIEDGRSGI